LESNRPASPARRGALRIDLRHQIQSAGERFELLRLRAEPR